jgi:hypothetical protein
MKIHTILNKEGTIDAKLFGEWRVKSYLIVALSCVERDDQEEAMAVLKKAKTVAMEYIDDIKSKQKSAISKEETASLKGLTSQMKEVRRLMADCVEKKKETKKIERRRAQAMFLSTSSKDTSDITSIEKAGDTKRPLNNETNNNENEVSQTNHTGATDEPRLVLKSVLNDKGSDKPTVRKSVSFSQQPPQVKEFDSSADHDFAPWYSQHKEALMLMAVAGLSVFAIMSLRRKA